MREVKFKDVEMGERFYWENIKEYLIKIEEDIGYISRFEWIPCNARECEGCNDGWFFEDDDIVFLTK